MLLALMILSCTMNSIIKQHELTRHHIANMQNKHVKMWNATNHGASCTRHMHLNTSLQIPSRTEHLESDHNTPKVSEAGAVINPPGLGAHEPHVGLAALKRNARKQHHYSLHIFRRSTILQSLIMVTIRLLAISSINVIVITIII